MKRIACPASIHLRRRPLPSHYLIVSSSPCQGSSVRRFCNHHCRAAIQTCIINRQFSSLPASNVSSSLTPAPSNSTLAPIDFTTSSTISGDESQILQVHLRPNQMLRAESGSMLYMTHGVKMETSMGLNSNDAGGLSTGLTRMMTDSPPNDETTANENNVGTVCLGTDFPAKILKLQLNHYPNSTVICQKGAYLAGSHSILMEMAFTKKFTVGFFGGEGFVLQKLRSGGSDNDETVFLKAYGTVVKKELRPNETLRVSSGSLVAMTSDVEYDVTTMSGFKNVMFGGEGLFVTTLTGPGTVWLQGMPIDRMVSEIARRVPSGSGIGLGVPLFGGGGGGSGGEEGAAAGEDVAVAEGGEEEATPNNETDAGVPLSDSAIEADRNATVASSGIMTDDSSSPDPESSESLFGDVAYGGDGAEPLDSGTSSTTSMGEDSISSMEDGFSQPQPSGMPEFEEPPMVEEQFEDDGTTFSTYDSNVSDGGSGSEEPPPLSDDEGGQSILSQLWDFFKDLDDD
ncbi:hypothetical protein ACHAWT_009638 [Skeletonema menzelii]